MKEVSIFTLKNSIFQGYGEKVNKTKHDILLGVIAKGGCVIRLENVAVIIRVKEKRTPKVTLCVI